jgi:hypothetical protein
MDQALAILSGSVDGDIEAERAPVPNGTDFLRPLIREAVVNYTFQSAVFQKQESLQFMRTPHI